MSAPPPVLSWRAATVADIALLAEWNHQLIRDEGHRNQMTPAELAVRLREWLQSEYQAVVFSDPDPVAYALFKHDASSIHLRQLFVRRDRRRGGVGRAAVSLLRREIWRPDVRLTVDVLCHNTAAVAFWRSAGYRDYSLTLEIMPEAGPPDGSAATP